MKTYFFISGLPRSGSTLLSSILNQNPDIYCSPEQSLVCDLIFNVENYILNSEEYNSWGNDQGKNKICKSIIDNFYDHRKEKFILDKCRTWGTPYNLNLIRKYITNDIKILCPVRPILEILTSFINLFDENIDKNIFVDNNIKTNQRFVYRDLNDARCDELMSLNSPIDKALFALSQSKLKENEGIFHIIEYDDLIFDTKNTIKKIYDFLGISYFDHSFENLKSSDEINHEYYNLPDLHKIRNQIGKVSKNPSEVLSKYVIKKYGSNYEVWR
jgi:sulfotransferase